MNVPRSELTEDVFKQADRLLKQSTMLITQGPGINSHLNKRAVREDIRKLRKDARDRLTGNGTGPTEAQKTSYNTAWGKATDPETSVTEFETFIHNNSHDLPIGRNGGINWNELRKIKKIFRDERNLEAK